MNSPRWVPVAETRATAFSQRASLITGNPRSASDPLNALLNHLYAILEAESRVALLAVGYPLDLASSTPTNEHATRWRSI